MGRSESGSDKQCGKGPLIGPIEGVLHLHGHLL